MEKITREDGSEVDVYTVEELEDQKQAALEEYKANNPDKTEELTKLQEELEKLKGKDMNFASLRKQKDEAEKKIEDILKGVDERVEKVKKEVLESVMQDHYNDNIKRLVGDDKELLAKVELQYKRLGDVASTKDEISKKLNDAFTLATGINKTAFDSGAYSSGGVGRVKINPSGAKLSDDEKEFANKLAQAGGIKLEAKDLE